MADTTITGVIGRAVWDSRGRPTVEVEVRCEGSLGRAIAPSGASTGTGEATDLRDGGRRLGGYGVHRALHNVNGCIAPALIGLDASDQLAIDQRLVELDATPDKSHLGGNAMIATSLATAWAAAGTRPLWEHLAEGAEVSVPMPEVQIVGGGAHAGGRIDIQDVMVVPLGAGSLAEGLEWAAEVYLAVGARLATDGLVSGVADEGGWWPSFDRNEDALSYVSWGIEATGREPGRDLAIAIDVAASQFGQRGRYRLACDGIELDSDGLCELLAAWTERYPICSVEDPLAEDDTAGTTAFTRAVGDRVQVVGDDLIVTSAERIRTAATDSVVNAVLIKPNQAGTLTAAKQAFNAARHGGLDTIVSARSGESEDVSIVHIAAGWDAGELKVGSIARGERTVKWNEALRVAEQMGPRTPFGARHLGVRPSTNGMV